MSLRPEVSGFSLQQLYEFLGSGDRSIIDHLISEFDNAVTFEKSELRFRAHAILRRAVYERPRWSDLEVEGEEHVFAAIVLARHGQTHLATTSNSWNMLAIWDFIKECHDQVPKEGRRYLSTFTAGRGLFTKRIETSWSFYGFLAYPELQRLLKALQDFQNTDSSRHSETFHFGLIDDLIAWLTMIESNNKDLWFHCY